MQMIDSQRISHMGLMAVYMGTVLEGETVLFLAALFVEQGVLPMSGVVVSGYLGALSGDLFCFWLGRRHGRDVFVRWPRLGKKIARMADVINAHRVLTVVSYRFVYGARSVVPVVLGMSGVGTHYFVLCDMCCAFVWTMLVLQFGRTFIASLGAGELVKQYQMVTACIVACLVFFLWVAPCICRMLSRKKSREDPDV
jgi:membrane protein DedA with SNARE-associated domain